MPARPMHLHASDRVMHNARQLRRLMTPAEVLLWSVLRDRQLEGFKVRRQHPIGPYIADFYIASAKLIIEVDGHSHAEDSQIVHDLVRDAWFSQHGHRTLRITNHEVVSNI